MLSSRFFDHHSRSRFCNNLSLKTVNQKKIQAETDSSHEELVSPSNIKKEKGAEEEGGERKTTIGEGSSKDNSNNSSSNNSNNSNDSYSQFGQSVANHLRESDLSKGALLVLQGEILATIAKHIA